MNAPVNGPVDDMRAAPGGEVTRQAEGQRQEPSLTFDPELDLAGLQQDDDEPVESERPQSSAPGGFSGFMRMALYGFGLLMILLIALILYARGSQGPSSAPPTTAKVDVLERALANQVERDVADAESPVTEEVLTQEPPVQSVQPREAAPGAHLLEAPMMAVTSHGASADQVMSVIAEIQQILEEQRGLIQSHQERNRQFQADLEAIRTSSEATNRRVDSLAADIAQVRHSLEDLTAKATSKVTQLQRQLVAKQQQQAKADEARQSALRAEPPPFRLVTVTLWGSDYIATLALSSGVQRDLTVGEMIEGWKVTDITASGVAVLRLRDGVNMTLAMGG